MNKEKMKHNEEILVAGGFLALYVGGGGGWSEHHMLCLSFSGLQSVLYSGFKC